jgi:Bacterial regulatory helix-turn-helix protein, lysR family
MEMHQVRYFVAVSRTLNFTRGADECNVTQPSLTRAIKQLDAELGGDLFRRERPAAQLTELAQRMHPLLKQCYEAAVGARSLALSFKGGKVGTLGMEAHMQVKLCARCPYTPDDLATHYEPKAALHLCAKCDSEEEEKNMLNSSLNLRRGKAKRCAVCDGRFGLIRYYSWRTPLCSKKCVDRFKARWAGDRKWLRRLQTA